MKKILSLAIVIMIIFAASSCSNTTMYPANPDSPAVDQPSENNNSPFTDVPNNNRPNNPSQQNKNSADAEETKFDTKWPRDIVGGLKKPNGNISNVVKLEAKGECSIIFTESKVEDLKEYINLLKKDGFSQSRNDEGSVSLICILSKGKEVITLINDKNNATTTLIYSKNANAE